MSVAQNKAQELFDLFNPLANGTVSIFGGKNNDPDILNESTKRICIYHVDGILKVLSEIIPNSGTVLFWEDVKSEIKKL